MSARLNSFTLMEVLVAMVISGIVMSMAAYAYFRLNEWYLKDAAQQEYIQRTELLETALRHDFLLCNRPVYSDGELIFSETNQYKFQKGVIVRTTAQRTDSFVFQYNVKVEKIEVNASPSLRLTLELLGVKKNIVLMKELPYQSAKK